jgi:cytochrome c biogenesis protein CcdA
VSTERVLPRGPVSRAALPFTAIGTLLAVIGILTWVTDSWALRIAGTVAILVGGYVAVMGIGLLMVRRQLARIAAERQVDDAIRAAAPAEGCGGSGEACATCDTACALRA